LACDDAASAVRLGGSVETHVSKARHGVPELVGTDIYLMALAAAASRADCVRGKSWWGLELG